MNFENMSNDDAVRVLTDIVHKPGSASELPLGPQPPFSAFFSHHFKKW